jgi:3-keto-disaccharide hydrolase
MSHSRSWVTGEMEDMMARLTLTVRRAGRPVAFALLLVAALATARPMAWAQAPWKVLFDGKDLNNFNASSGWRIQDGVLLGGPPEPGKHFSRLETREKYFNFELQLDFLLKEFPGVRCTQELGPHQEEMSDRACDGNSGVYYRSGYQLNLGRREAGEFIGLVVHRVDPKALRGNILWLSDGDNAYPHLRRRNQWNRLRIVVEGDHHQAWLNGTKIVDVTDTPTASEADWKVPQPIAFQMPYIPGITIKFRNMRVRTLQSR